MTCVQMPRVSGKIRYMRQKLGQYERTRLHFIENKLSLKLNALCVNYVYIKYDITHTLMRMRTTYTHTDNCIHEILETEIAWYSI